MNFKFNHEVYLLVLYEKYDEIVEKSHVIFEKKNYAQTSQKAIIHVKMLHVHEKIKRTHYEKKLAIIKN